MSGYVGVLAERYQETVIKMFNQPNKTGLGRTLQVEDRTFEDLGESVKLLM
jgi:hypothetical protein